MTILKLHSSNPTPPAPPVRGCGTCRFFYDRPYIAKCAAVGGLWADRAYTTVCNHGQLWEAKPPSFFSRVGNAVIAWLKS